MTSAGTFPNWDTFEQHLRPVDFSELPALPLRMMVMSHDAIPVHQIEDQKNTDETKENSNSGLGTHDFDEDADEIFEESETYEKNLRKPNYGHFSRKRKLTEQDEKLSGTESGKRAKNFANWNKENQESIDSKSNPNPRDGIALDSNKYCVKSALEKRAKMKLPDTKLPEAMRIEKFRLISRIRRKMEDPVDVAHQQDIMAMFEWENQGEGDEETRTPFNLSPMFDTA